MQKQLRFTKRTLALVLVLVMAIGMFPVTASAASDYDSHWSKEFIDDAISRGWMKGDGDGTFRPDASITRAEFAVMLWRAYGEPTPIEANPFSDVAPGDWFYNATAALYEMGVTSGVGDNLFDPQGTLTREMGMTMLARAFGVEAENDNAYSQFADASQVSSWAGAAVSALVENGYVNGIGDGLFAPKNPLKRGEMARILIVVFDGEGTPGGTIGDGSIAITLTKNPTAVTTGNVTVTVAVESESEVTFIGRRQSTEGATYNNKVGFLDITNDGKFVATKNGWYAVWVENAEGASAYKLIQVTNITSATGGGGSGGGSVAVTDVTLDKTTLALTIGDTETLTATVNPDNATTKTIAWTSSDVTVATVTGGVVTAVAEGTATITATSNNGKTATCAVTVTAQSEVAFTIRTVKGVAPFGMTTLYVLIPEVTTDLIAAEWTVEYNGAPMTWSSAAGEFRCFALENQDDEYYKNLVQITPPAQPQPPEPLPVLTAQDLRVTKGVAPFAQTTLYVTVPGVADAAAAAGYVVTYGTTTLEWSEPAGAFRGFVVELSDNAEDYLASVAIDWAQN